MEKRYISFLLASMCVLMGYSLLQQAFFPPPKPVAKLDADAVVAGDADPAGEGPGGDASKDAKSDDANSDDAAASESTKSPDAASPPESAASESAASESAVTEVSPSTTSRDGADDETIAAPSLTVSLGSLAPESPYRMLVSVNSVGGCIERIELNSRRYLELDFRGGYLGHLGLKDAEEGGVRVNVVGPGTPAASAVSDGTDVVGLQGPQLSAGAGKTATIGRAGDRIVEFNSQPIEDAVGFRNLLRRTHPGQKISLQVFRSDENGDEKPLTYQLVLTKSPLQLLRPDREYSDLDLTDQPDNRGLAPDLADPQSFLLTLDRIGDSKVEFGNDEIEGLPSLHRRVWTTIMLPEQTPQRGPGVEFRTRLTPADLKAIGATGDLQLVKRYWLNKVDKDDVAESSVPPEGQGYLLTLEIEIENRAQDSQTVGYQLDGPQGLTTEGWWYLYKVHPTKFSGAGARDVIWRSEEGQHELFVCSKITSNAKKKPDTPQTPLFDSQQPVRMRYAGLDAQYFSVVLLPEKNDDPDDPFDDASNYFFRSGSAYTIGLLDTKSRKRTNVSYRLSSRQIEIPAGGKFEQRYRIFAGPKDDEILTQFGLEDCIVYGWFGVISKPMLWALHNFKAVLGSFGLAIVLLTVLVRGCMYPIGRKMALNARKMQELAPEMKKIADKYASDLEKRSEAQRELFRKHNYNPMSGCFLMFFQLPIFVALYRCLSVDIALRQAPLIPGISWCDNLAGPDKLLYWRDWLPAALSAESGWLGPYLNILPVLAVVLMLVQQKLFTPPPTDEQQQMQQQVMKFMMLFMAVLFHKFAAGLCIYFIASSIWGIGERLMLPKADAKPPTSAPDEPPKKSFFGRTPANGAAMVAAEKAKKKKRSKRK